jgi:hypothetical protein
MSAPVAPETRSPFKRQQADQRVVAWVREPSGDEEGTDFVAVQSRRVGLVVEARPPHMHRG